MLKTSFAATLGLVFLSFSACQNATPTPVLDNSISSTTRQAPKPADFNPDDLNAYQEFQIAEKQNLIQVFTKSLINSPKWSRGDAKQAQAILDALSAGFQPVLNAAKEAEAQSFSDNVEAFFEIISQQLTNTNGVNYYQSKLDIYRKSLPAVKEQLNSGDFGKFYAQNFALDLHLTVLNHLLESNKIEIAYDQFEILNLSSQANPVVGKPFVLELALGASSSKARYAATVNNNKLTIDANNRARYTFTPKVRGTQSFEAEISLVNPLTGETLRAKKTFTYTVVAK